MARELKTNDIVKALEYPGLGVPNGWTSSPISPQIREVFRIHDLHKELGELEIQGRFNLIGTGEIGRVVLPGGSFDPYFQPGTWNHENAVLVKTTNGLFLVDKDSLEIIGEDLDGNFL